MTLWEDLVSSCEDVAVVFEELCEELTKAVEKCLEIFRDWVDKSVPEWRDVKDRTWKLTPTFARTPCAKLGKMYQFRTFV